MSNINRSRIQDKRSLNCKQSTTSLSEAKGRGYLLKVKKRINAGTLVEVGTIGKFMKSKLKEKSSGVKKKPNKPAGLVLSK